MREPRSIAGRLRRGLIRVGLLASALLLLFILFDFDRMFDLQYRRVGIAGLAYEVGDHVVLPLTLLLVPLLLMLPSVIRRSLEPLVVAKKRIEAASGHDRGIRVDLAGLPEEALPFARAVNDLLARLDEAAARQEAFAADVAHELKTPLAIAELKLARHRGPLVEELREEIGSMNRLIDQLMLMAQVEADAVSHMPHGEVPLADIAADVSARLAPIALASGRSIALEVIETPVVLGRREAIRAALRNLVENAQRFVPVGGTVIIFVGPGPQLRVRDEGPGISAQQLQLLKQRHQRADRASPGGAGLGMAIVSRIMAAHGGSLETEPDLRELQLRFAAAPQPGFNPRS